MSSRAVPPAAHVGGHGHQHQQQHVRHLREHHVRGRHDVSGQTGQQVSVLQRAGGVGAGRTGLCG